MTLPEPVLLVDITPEAQLYLDLSQQTRDTLDSIAYSHVAQRFYDLMSAKIAQLEPHRAQMARFFAEAMQSDAPQGIFPQDAMTHVFTELVQRSTDAPTRPEEVEGLANLLYALYLLSVLFWLYDRTPQRAATAHLLDFAREMIRLMRPMMIMPLFTKALSKISTIIGMVFQLPR
jgi:AcrR family transcriptional regulator